MRNCVWNDDDTRSRLHFICSFAGGGEKEKCLILEGLVLGLFAGASGRGGQTELKGVRCQH